jgi:type II secretory pathway component GspD/PulD (secretin)
LSPSFAWWPVNAHSVFVSAILLGAIYAPASVVAAEPKWPTESYNYIVVDQDLRTVLEQFGINTGLRVVLSDAVQGKVRGRLPPASPRQFLNDVTEMFGLDWYYDGAAIAVSAKSEAQTELITLKGSSFSKLETALESAGINDDRYQLRAGPDEGSVIASGPPRYLAAVKRLVVSLSPASPQSSASTYVTIMRGPSVSRIDFP